MKGDYDDHLQWPFRKKVTFQILDQGSGQNHLTGCFTPDANGPEDCLQKPRDIDQDAARSKKIKFCYKNVLQE